MEKVKIIVSNVYSKIAGFIPDNVNEILDKTLSYRIQNFRFMKKFRDGKWDGIIHLYYKSRGQIFYSGLMALVREILKKNNIEYEIVDRMVRPGKSIPNLKFSPPRDYEPRKYQDFTVERALQYTRGVLSIGTGGGKTLIASRIIAGIQSQTVFYVLTKDLMEQAHGVLSACLNEPIGKVGDGEVDVKRITVCTIQSAVRALKFGDKKLKISDYKFDDEDEWDEKDIDSQEKAEKIKKMIQLAEVVIFDEVHHSSSKTAVLVLTNSINAYWRFGLSATPIREDGASIVIQAMFGVKVVEISSSYLIRQKDLVKPYIFMVPINSKANFHSYQKIYENCVVKNEEFNRNVARDVNHLVKRGLSVLVLVQQYKQGDFLKLLIPNSEFITGKVSSEKRLQYINDLREGKITLIATSLADEGLDARDLGSVVMAGGGKSVTKINQRLGRALRRDKKSSKQKDKAIVIIYEHNAKHLEKHAKRVRSILKKEPEFVIIDSAGPEFICGEIDKILGVKNDAPNLFES